MRGLLYMLIGYMRVSSADERQSVGLQRDALLSAGIDERQLFSDKADGRACRTARRNSSDVRNVLGRHAIGVRVGSRSVASSTGR
jgi:hypothetical protein